MNHPSGTFPWYTIVDRHESLSQGDFVDDLPIIPPLPIPPLSEIALSGEETHIEQDISPEYFDVIVMTQSCDLEDFEDNDHVVLCPRYDFEVFAQAQEWNSKKRSEQWGNLIRGRLVGLHLLSNSTLDRHQFDYQIVVLKRVFSVQFGFLRQFVQRQNARVRLLPPYREHLGQAFARQFMRIGLPIDLPRKYPRIDSDK